MAEKIVMTNSNDATSALFGPFDMNVRMIENAFDVRISNRNKETTDGDAIVVEGNASSVDKACRTLEYLKHMAGAGDTLEEQSIEYVIGKKCHTIFLLCLTYLLNMMISRSTHVAAGGIKMS